MKKMYYKFPDGVEKDGQDTGGGDGGSSGTDKDD